MFALHAEKKSAFSQFLKPFTLNRNDANYLLDRLALSLTGRNTCEALCFSRHVRLTKGIHACVSVAGEMYI